MTSRTPELIFESSLYLLPLSRSLLALRFFSIILYVLAAFCFCRRGREMEGVGVKAKLTQGFWLLSQSEGEVKRAGTALPGCRSVLLIPSVRRCF